MDEPTFRIEEGLPAYGPPALSFPRPDAYSEGLVVSFTTINGERWTGNFARGPGSVSIVRGELGPAAVIVVADGAAYCVDIEAKQAAEIAWSVSYVEYVASQRIMVLGNGLWFDAMSADGLRWRTRRISWDEMRAIQCGHERLVGEAFTPMGPPDWAPFENDQTTNKNKNSTNNGP